ncbi:hypothetical protein OAF34_05140 [Pirellulaceae bacterium]|nr:hypothetical protein [Pirellulaceae bacterium]
MSRERLFLYGYFDMTENLIAAGFLLLSGALIIGKFRSGGKSAVWWIGLTALVVGPLLAFAYHQLDVYWLNRDFYVTSEERNESLRPTLMLGFFGGLLAALFLGVGVLKREKLSLDGKD